MGAIVKEEGNLATDSINIGKILFLMLIVFAIVILAFYSTNIPALKDKANVYWVLGVTSLAIWGVSKGITKTKGLDFPNPIIWESKAVWGQVTRKHIYIMALVGAAISIFLFFSIASAPTLSIVAAPKFQILEVTREISSLLVVFASIMEDFFFWGVILSVLYGITFLTSRNHYISLAVTGIATPLTFMFFHTLVYGTTNVPASTSVFFFGLTMTIMVLVTRNLMLPIMVHATNNLALTYFEGTGGVSGIAWLGYTLIFIMILLSGYIYFRRRK